MAIAGWWLTTPDRDVEIGDSAVAPPAGPLFVLPENHESLTLANGWIERIDTGAVSARSLWIAGTKVGDSYEGTVSISVSADSPDSIETWELTSTPSGPVYVTESIVSRAAREQRDRWLEVTTNREAAQDARQLLGRIRLDGDGNLVEESLSGLVILERVQVGRSDEVVSTTFEVTGAGSRGLVRVETATIDPLLAPAVAIAESVRAISINDSAGWHVARTDADGEWNGVVWHIDGRMVAVSGHVPLEQVMDVATSLGSVPGDEWSAATGEDLDREPAD